MKYKHPAWSVDNGFPEANKDTNGDYTSDGNFEGIIDNLVIWIIKTSNRKYYAGFVNKDTMPDAWPHDIGLEEIFRGERRGVIDTEPFRLQFIDNKECPFGDYSIMGIEEDRITSGCNVLLYGVPGSGKSWTIEHEYCKKETNVERLVFHPDYTYSDFIGQILPNVDDDGQVSYKFTSGPFTNILADAYRNPEKEYILIIEEINRGTKVNGGRTRNLPEHDKEKRAAFVKYNIRDVEAELAIQRRLEKFPVPDFVWEEFWLDQEINDRGIALDMAVVENAIVFDKHSKDKLTAKIQNSENPNSVIQMKAWLLENGIEADTLDKKAVKELIRSTPAHIREVLEIRQKLAKSSVKKYQAMENAVCTDHRARGMFRFYGANRSGRWAGRMIQLQNLPQNHLPDLWEARELVKTGNYEAMEFLYDDIPDTLSQLIRTVFVPREGMKFVVADFSVIEARVLSYLAKEEWRSEVFRNNGDIYCASASAMFGVPVEKHGVNAHLRQKGKIAELALGYGGSVGALTAMGAIEMGLTEDELQPLVDSWRSANPNIVQFWWAVDRCVKKNISTQKHTVFIFYYKSGMLFIELPSGRRLSYVKPKMGVNKFGSESVVYEGIGGTKKWEQIESYGPKFMENIVQAISRDILAYAMRTLSHCFICGHVHDELIIECTKDVSLDAICEQMGRTPSWIPGLLLRADGYECDFYKKD